MFSSFRVSVFSKSVILSENPADDQSLCRCLFMTKLLIHTGITLRLTWYQHVRKDCIPLILCTQDINLFTQVTFCIPLPTTQQLVKQYVSFHIPGNIWEQDMWTCPHKIITCMCKLLSFAHKTKDPVFRGCHKRDLYLHIWAGSAHLVVLAINLWSLF